MRVPRFAELVGAVLALIALAVVAYAAVIQDRPEALGAVIAIVAASNSYFLRAKIDAPKG